MLLRGWRLITIVMTALCMGPALAHLLEMPAKLQYDGALWVRLQQSLYASFGTVGAFFEVAAILLAVVLVALVRARPRALRWTVLGAVCLLAAHVSFWVWIAPVNATVSGLTPDALPPGWEQLRSRWETTHAARALLETAGLGALVFSVLVEVPEDPGGRSTLAEARSPRV